MTSPSNSNVQNLLPVQAYFSVDGTFQTFIGQGQPFYAIPNPDQSGLNITNSTINSTTIGATTPSSAAFTTATVSTAPVSGNDVVNKTYLDYFAAGLSWKQPVLCATTTNITLSGLQAIDGVTVVAGDRVLVKSQSTNSQNGIYLASASAWSRSPDADTWNELVSAICFVEEGSTYAGTAWYCTAQAGGTIGTTAVVWSNFSVAASYTAGTGLTLTANQFSITNTGVTAGAYGSASKTLTATVNAQGQLTVLADTNIAISNTQVSGLGTMSTQAASSVAITGGTINGVTIGGTTAGAVTGTTITATTFNGAGTGLTGTASSLSIGGNAATATLATTATNIASGSVGSLPYQSGSGATSMLALGTTNYVLTAGASGPQYVAQSTLSVGSATTATNVSGTVAIANGGTGITAVTANGIVYASSTSALATSSALTFDGTNLTNTGSETAARFIPSGSTVATNGMYLPTTDTLGFSTASNERMRIDNAGNVGIGGTAAAFVKQQILGTYPTSSNVTQVVRASGTIPSGSTTSATIFQSIPTTAASAFTLGNLYHFSADQQALGASSAVTTQIGFAANSTLTGATNNYGFYGSIASGTGRYNLYMAGTAQNYFAGDVITNGKIGLGTAGSPSYGTSGQVLTSAGSGASPTWQTPVNYATVSDDTTTNATRYPLFAATTTGNLTTEYVSSTRLKFNPSTGALTASQLIIAP